MPNTDELLERMRMRRQLLLWRTLGVLLIVALGVALVSQFGGADMEKTGRDYIARISIDGIIVNDPERLEKLDAIAENPRIKAVIMDLDTPGGTVVGGELLYKKIKDLAAQKPVVAVMGDMATSAGYLVAIASNRIYAQHGTLTGSIGVLLQSADVTELSKKVGVQMQLIKSAPLKGTPSIFETLTPEAHQSLQDVVNSFFDYFIALVAKERNLPEPEVRRLADGRVYTGTQALTLKLVDEIGDEEAARNWLVSQKQIPSTLHVHDVSLVEEPAGWARLLPIEPPAKGLLDRLSLMGLVSIW